MNKKRLLITGVSGLLGSNLALYWRRTFDILGFYHSHRVRIEGVATQEADLLEPKTFAQKIKDFDPGIIVHCAALADVDACQLNRQAAMDANATAVRNLAGFVKDEDIKLVHISTDAVYDGHRGNYREQDPAGPLNIYGETKLLGEAHALTVPNALVVRTAFYGFNIQRKKCFAERIPEDLAAGRTIQGFSDVVTSSIYTMDLAELLNVSIEHDLTGIYHVAASDAVSKYDFSCLIARHLGFSGQLIRPARAADHSFKAPRPRNLSLNVQKLSSALGKPIVTVEQSVTHFTYDYPHKTEEINDERIPSESS